MSTTAGGVTARHMHDLVNYIYYRSPDMAADSQVVSVFDLLYKELSPKLLRFKERVQRRSGHMSEDIAATLLEVMLRETKYEHLYFARQIQLRDLVAWEDCETTRERQFLGNPRTSVDFVVYSLISNTAVLAIEVDGHQHQADPKQVERDRLKDALLARADLDLLRLRTDGSTEGPRIRRALEPHERE